MEFAIFSGHLQSIWRRLFVSDVNAAFNHLLPFVPNRFNFASKDVNVGCL